MTMKMRITELGMKEVVNIADGGRYGYVGDMELDPDSGRIKTLIIPCRWKLFGLLGREADSVIPWEAVQRFGEDVILVDRSPERRRLDRPSARK